MDATDESPPNAQQQQPWTKVPIAQLSPTLEQAEEKGIHATVTLVWPYSSSTKSLALLLAEPDFRLRRLNGQVKVVFHGRVAEKVAGSLVGIGDTVRLALKGLAFVENGATTQTPGRSIAWDVHFDKNVSLEVESSRTQSTISISQQTPTTTHEAELQPPSTPRLDNTFVSNGPGAWGSPAFIRSARSSYGDTLDSAYDPFTEEDGFIRGKGRKRPRYSLQREDWKVVNEPESPREQEGSFDWDKAVDEYMDLDQDTESVTNVESGDNPMDHVDSMTEKPTVNEDPFVEDSGGFVKPSLDLAGGLFGRRALPSNDTSVGGLFGNTFPTPPEHLPTDTPLLRPVPSPGLPIPSPIVSNQANSQGYFSPFHTAPQAEEAQSLSVDVSISAASQVLTDGLNGPQPQSTPLYSETTENEQNERQQELSQSEITVSATNPSNQDHILKDNLDVSANPEDLLESFTSQLPDTSDMAIFDVEPEHVDEVDATRIAAEPTDHSIDYLETRKDSIEAVFADERQNISSASPLAEDTMLEDIGARGATAIDLMESGQEVDAPLNKKLQQEIIDTTSPHHSERLESQSGSDEEASEMESDAEDAILSEHADQYDYDESRDAHYENEYEDEDQEEMYSGEEGEYEEEDDYQSESPPPRPQPTHEVIVLDSDSEDELASDQPVAPPSSRSMDQVRRPEHSSPSGPTLSSLARLDSEEEWSGLEEEASYDEMEDAESERDAEKSFNQDDRVDDSDLVDESGSDEEGDFHQDQQVHNKDSNEESSVDILAREDYTDQQSTSKASVESQKNYYEFEEEDIEADEDEEEVEDYSEVEAEDEPQGDFEKVERPQPVIDLDSDEDGDEEVAEAFSVDPESLSQTSHGGRNYGMDGFDDRPLPSSFAESNDQISNNEPPHLEVRAGDFEQDLGTGGSVDESLEPPLNLTAHQLPTPDPTQETIPTTEPIAVADATTVQPEITPIASTGLDIPLPTTPEPSFQEKQPGDDREYTPIVDDVNQERDDMENNNNVPEPPKVLISAPQTPDRHAHGLRSKLSYFAPLATLIDHYNAIVDTISVVRETTPVAKATSGPKDFFITIQLTDPSMAGTTVQAQIFRRRKTAIPSIIPGNAILLRDFKVRTYDHTIMLVSVESSSWAVFDGTGPDAQMNGPPVEYGSEEAAYASDLCKWYNEVGMDMLADSELQAAIEKDTMSREPSPGSMALSEVGSPDSASRENSITSSRGLRRSRNSHRRVTIHELRDGTRYTEVGSPSTKDSIHELRDGTVYATR